MHGRKKSQIERGVSVFAEGWGAWSYCEEI